MDTSWKNNICYVVGDKTQSEVLKCLADFVSDPTGADTGSAKELVKVIRTCGDSLKLPLLYPKSNLADVAVFEGISMEAVDAYETVAHPDLEAWCKTFRQELLLARTMMQSS